jgi:hypothetical protein
MRPKKTAISRPAGRRTRLALAAIALAIAAAAVLAGPRALAAFGFAPAAPAAQDDGGQGPEPLILQLTSTGFAQDLVQVQPGAKLLMIRNGSGADNLVFTVTRPGPDETLTAQVGRGGRYSTIVPFSPGQTTVAEASHPDWVCTIDVAP